MMLFYVFFFFFKQKTAYEIMPSLVGSEMCIRDRLKITRNPSSKFRLKPVALTKVQWCWLDRLCTRLVLLLLVGVSFSLHRYFSSPSRLLLMVYQFWILHSAKLSRMIWMFYLQLNSSRPVSYTHLR